MLKTAQANCDRAGLSQQMHLARGDAADFDAAALFGRPKFDRVMFSYTLSMVPVWREALEMAASVLAPEGELHIVDFGMQQRLPRWFSALLGAWLAKFHVTRRDELREACEALAARHGLRMHYQSLYRDYAQRIVLRRVPA
jgi:S-adenosylmethionine-diacylgycerolhomoserine-N-methlytransferase